jgi:hypothetical protein
MRSDYSLKSIKKGIRNPDLVIREIGKVCRQVGLKIDKQYYTTVYGSDGEDFIDRDWDNLLILDACRPEFLSDCDLPNGSFTTIKSPASESFEFMEKNFIGRDLHDIVYITANPHNPKIPDGTFYRKVNLLDTHWDKEYMTVLPEDVVEKSLEIFDQHPNKRFIIHFMQPHFPFLSRTGQDVDDSGITVHLEDRTLDRGRQPWSKAQTGDEAHDRIIQAYRENHQLVMKHVSELTDKLTGKTVVTSDHANLIGERLWPIPIKYYGHPRGLRKPELITVPWLELETDSRREITTSSPIDSEDMSEEAVQERLVALGYM